MNSYKAYELTLPTTFCRHCNESFKNATLMQLLKLPYPLCSNGYATNAGFFALYHICI